MSRPRVLIGTPDFPPAPGGIQRLLGALVAHAQSWDSLVVTLGHPDAGPEPGRTRRVARPAGIRRAGMAWLNVAIVREGRRRRTDAVVCGHIAVSPGALALGRLLRIPVVQYVYSKELTDRAALARFALTRSAATIAISAHTARLAIAAGANPARVHVIPPGVDVPDGPLPRPDERADMPTILTVARLTDRYKGFDVMLRALPLVRARIPGVRWVVIGDGALRPELERTAERSGIADRVRFCGTVTDAERDAWFRRAHVFAMPSRLPTDGGGEGYGLVYLEAGAHGLPCVAGDRGAVAEVVVHGETGLLVDATDHVAVADALIELLADRERAAVLGAAGRRQAEASSWERMAAAVEALVHDLIGNTGKRP